MKRVSILFVLLISVFVANAWHRQRDEAVVIVASKHLSPKAKKLVKKYLGSDYSDDVHYLYDTEKELAKQKKLKKGARNIHDLHLDKNLRPKNVKGEDSYKAINKALTVVRNHKNHSKEEVRTALRVVINLICDFHSVAKVRLDGYPHSYKPFSYTTQVREWGPKSVLTKTHKWRTSWLKFDGGFPLFSPKYWAEDMEIFIGDKYAEYSKGTLDDWATEVGTIAAYYLEFCKPDARVPYMEFKSMEVVNYELYVKAACRLAALLNENLK